MGLGNYLVTLSKLQNIGRWSNEFLHRRANVSTHSFMVTQIGQMLGIIEEENGNTVDWKRLFSKLLNHDVTETLTGDILSTIKHSNPEMKAMVKKIEKQVTEAYILAPMEENYRNKYREVLFDGKDETLEGQILTFADAIDSLIECMNEIKLANYYPFEEKYEELLNELKKSELFSVQYFIKNILPEMIKGVHRLERSYKKVLEENEKE